MSEPTKINCDEKAVVAVTQLLEPGEKLVWADFQLKSKRDRVKSAMGYPLLTGILVIGGLWLCWGEKIMMPSKAAIAIIGATSLWIWGAFLWDKLQKTRIMALTDRRVLVAHPSRKEGDESQQYEATWSIYPQEITNCERIADQQEYGKIRLHLNSSIRKRYKGAGKHFDLNAIQQVETVAMLLETSLGIKASD